MSRKSYGLVFSSITLFAVSSVSFADGAGDGRFYPTTIQVQFMNVDRAGAKTPLTDKEIDLNGECTVGLFNIGLSRSKKTQSSNTDEQGLVSFDFPDMDSWTTYVWVDNGYWYSDSLCAKVDGPYYCYDLDNGLPPNHGATVEQPLSLDPKFFFAKDENGTPLSLDAQNALPLSCSLTLLGRFTANSPRAETWEFDCKGK